jgi:hypothetical protein
MIGYISMDGLGLGDERRVVILLTISWNLARFIYFHHGASIFSQHLFGAALSSLTRTSELFFTTNHPYSF